MNEMGNVCKAYCLCKAYVRMLMLKLRQCNLSGLDFIAYNKNNTPTIPMIVRPG